MNTEYFTQASLAIQIHMVVAIAAFVLGGYLMLRRKGTPSHKMIGRVFAVLMIVAATSAIFIRTINQGSFSWIHIFVLITFIGLYHAVSAVRKGDVKRHRRHVMGLFFGALLIPGIFAFMPGRTMWMLFFA